jgi:hypothetical protein
MTKIQLLQDDIDKGLPARSAFCPVARAIRRACPKIKQVNVGCSRIRLGDGQYITTPPEVCNFISAFDRHKPVEPFEFDLDIPEDLTE